MGAPILEVYATWGYTAMREILADLLRIAIPPAERLLDVQADVPLEVSVNRQGKRLIVHLDRQGGRIRYREPLARVFPHAEPNEPLAPILTRAA